MAQRNGAVLMLLTALWGQMLPLIAIGERPSMDGIGFDRNALSVDRGIVTNIKAAPGEAMQSATTPTPSDEEEEDPQRSGVPVTQSEKGMEKGKEKEKEKEEQVGEEKGWQDAAPGRPPVGSWDEECEKEEEEEEEEEEKKEGTNQGGMVHVEGPELAPEDMAVWAWVREREEQKQEQKRRITNADALPPRRADDPSKGMNCPRKAPWSAVSISDVLDSGVTSVVFEVLIRCGDQCLPAAMKVMHELDSDVLRLEARLMENVLSPHIVSGYGSYVTQLTPEEALNGNCIYVAMELGDNKLTNVIEELTLEEIAHMTYELLLGLKYLHDHGLGHHDLKPDNILIFTQKQADKPSRRVAKLADLGETCCMPARQICKINDIANYKRHCDAATGITFNYESPRHVKMAMEFKEHQGKQFYFPEDDLWAIGKILLQLLHKSKDVVRLSAEKKLYGDMKPKQALKVMAEQPPKSERKFLKFLKPKDQGPVIDDSDLAVLSKELDKNFERGPGGEEKGNKHLFALLQELLYLKKFCSYKEDSIKNEAKVTAAAVKLAAKWIEAEFLESPPGEQTVAPDQHCELGDVPEGWRVEKEKEEVGFGHQRCKTGGSASGSSTDS